MKIGGNRFEFSRWDFDPSSPFEEGRNLWTRFSIRFNDRVKRLPTRHGRFWPINRTNHRAYIPSSNRGRVVSTYSTVSGSDVPHSPKSGNDRVPVIFKCGPPQSWHTIPRVYRALSTLSKLSIDWAIRQKVRLCLAIIRGITRSRISRSLS